MVNSCKCHNCIFQGLLFESLSDEQMETICATREEEDYAKGDHIFEEGHRVERFLYLKDGLVKLYRQCGPERSQIISIAKPKDFVSLLNIFGSEHYQYSVSALEDSTICTIDLDLVKQTIESNGAFAMNLMKKMSRSSDGVINNICNINKKNLRGRIAYILLYFSDTIYKKPEFELPVSRREIAELIGMTTENVIRILSEFRKDGIIRTNGKLIGLQRQDLLKKIADAG